MLNLRKVAVALAGFCAFLNLYSPQAVLPLLAKEFAVGPADISMTMTAATLAIAFIAPFTGAAADVLGRKRVIAAAMLGLVVPTVFIAFAPNLPVLLALRFVQGLLMPPIFAVTVAYIGEEWPPAEATAMTGVFTAASSFGGFLGRFLTGILADTVGWRAAFLANGALTVICAVSVLLLLPRERQFVGATNLLDSGRQMLTHLRNPRLVATFAIGFGVLFNFVATFTYINFHLAAPPYNFSSTLLGSVFIVYLIGSVTTPWTGRLVSRFGRRHLVVSLIALWIGGLLLTLAPPVPLIIIGLTIAAGCGFMCQASSMSFITTTTKKGTSSAVGLYVTTFYIGGSVGAILPGLTWHWGGWPVTILMVACMLSLIATNVWFAWRPVNQPTV